MSTADDVWELLRSASRRPRRCRAAVRRVARVADTSDPRLLLATATLATHPNVQPTAAPEDLAQLLPRALHAAQCSPTLAAEATVRGDVTPFARRVAECLPARITPSQAAAIVTQVARLYAESQAGGDDLPPVRSETLPALPHDGALALLVGGGSPAAAKFVEHAVIASDRLRDTELLLAALVPARHVKEDAACRLCNALWAQREKTSLVPFARALGWACGQLAARGGMQHETMSKMRVVEADAFVLGCLPGVVGRDAERATQALEHAAGSLPVALIAALAQVAGAARLMRSATELLADAQRRGSTEATTFCNALVLALDTKPTAAAVPPEHDIQAFVDAAVAAAHKGNDGALNAGSALVRSDVAPMTARSALCRRLVGALAARLRIAPPLRAALAVIDAVAAYGDAPDAARILMRSGSPLAFALIMRLAVRCEAEVLEEVLAVASSVGRKEDGRAARIAVLGADSKRKETLVAWILALERSRTAKL